MVCSQVYSQHPSHCKFSNVHQHRYGAFSNAEVHCREPETSEADWVGNTTPDGHFLSSKGYACSGYASITSPFKSSWIQRLIPSHNTSVEQAQPSDKFNEDNHCIDVLQTNWKENAGHLTTLGNQSKFPVYENSRRTKQDFFNSHQTYLGTNTPECVPNGFITMPFEAPNALPPEIQVSPKPLPIVESLLPGYSKKVTENQTSTETNMSHILSRGMELANPMKQTVHYSADEKSRVSCSSTERLNSHSVVRAAGDLLALNSSQMVQRRVGPSQPSSEFSFNSIGAFTQSNMDLTYGGKDMQTGTNLRMHKFKAQTYGLSLDRLSSPKTISKRNGCNPKEHHSCAHDGSETLYARDGSFDGGWWPNLNIEKDEPRQISNLVPLHGGANVAKQKVGISFSQHMLEQDLGSLHGSHEEQGGTSRSFSFHIENRLASELDYAKIVARKGQWPFGSSTLSNEDLVQSRWSEDNRARGLAEVTRPGLPCDSSFIFQETGVCKAGTAYIGRSQSSPIFGMEKLNESASRRISDNHDVSPYKAACIDIGGVFTGEMNAQALPGNSVDHESSSRRISDNHDVSPHKAACIDIRGVFTGEMNAHALPDNSVDQAGQTLQGGHPLDRLESNLMMEGVEGRELMLSFPRTVSVENWKAFRPSLQSSTRKCSPEGACLNHTDGNCVSANNWKAFKPPIRSRIYTCPPEGAQSNHADGSKGSIGSCSKRPSNLCSEDASTSADARSRPITQEKPSVALQKQLHSSQRQCAGSGVSNALDDRESEGREAIGWRASGSAVKQNIWIQRWSTMRSKKFQSISRSNREGRVLAHARNYVEKDYCTSHGSRESSHHSAKRICYARRSGLLPGNAISKIGSFSVGRGHTEKGVTSHFMKRFFTPSAAAMAIMGMTAREVHATQPQRNSLFGVWDSNASTRKPSGAQSEVCKEFCTRPNFKKEIPQSAAKAPLTSVDL